MYSALHKYLLPVISTYLVVALHIGIKMDLIGIDATDLNKIVLNAKVKNIYIIF